MTNLRLLPLLVGAFALPLTAQQFRENEDWVLPFNGSSMVIGDVDLDGHPDMICGRSGSLVLARSDGRLFRDETMTRLPTPTGSLLLLVSDLDLADLDGDGDLDLLIACQNERSSEIYRNDGSGVFSDATTILLPPATYGVLRHLVADVDLDGDMDVFVDTASGPDRLLRNNGSGVFTDVTSTQLPSGSASHLLAAGDLDGDLDPDVILGPLPSVLINDGTGRFTVGPPLATPWLLNASFADLNGDGRLDVVARGFVANSSTLLLSKPNGALVPAPGNGVPAWLGMFDLADIDNDGDVDIVGYSILLNDGSGRFNDATAGAFPPLTLMHRIVRVVDLDRDDDKDILMLGAIGCWTCPPQVLLNHRIQLLAPSPPVVGLPYDLQVFASRDAAQDPALALPFGSFAPGNAVVPGLGWFGISLNSAVTLPWLMLPAPNTTATLTIPVPPSPQLWGLSLYFQAVVLMHDGRILRSNSLADRIQ